MTQIMKPQSITVKFMKKHDVLVPDYPPSLDGVYGPAVFIFGPIFLEIFVPLQLFVIYYESL